MDGGGAAALCSGTTVQSCTQPLEAFGGAVLEGNPLAAAQLLLGGGLPQLQLTDASPAAASCPRSAALTGGQFLDDLTPTRCLAPCFHPPFCNTYLIRDLGQQQILTAGVG